MAAPRSSSETSPIMSRSYKYEAYDHVPRDTSPPVPINVDPETGEVLAVSLPIGRRKKKNKNGKQNAVVNKSAKDVEQKPTSEQTVNNSDAAQEHVSYQAQEQPQAERDEESTDEETAPLITRGGYEQIGGSHVVNVEELDASAIRARIEENNCLWPSLGIMLVVLAGFGFTASNVVQNLYLKNLNFYHMLFVRAVFQAAISALDVLRRGCGVFGGTPSLKLKIRIVLQGAIGGCLLFCIFFAVSNVPLGNASAIFFCTPVFTFIFASFMLGEKFGLFRLMLSVMMMAGVVLITRPPFLFPEGADDKLVGGDGISWIAYFVAFCVPCLSAIVSILTRQLKSLPPTVLMLWFGIGAFFLSLIGSITDQDLDLFHYNSSQWPALLFVVMMGILGNLLYTVAMKWVSPSKANVFRSFEVILNCFLQIAIQHYEFHPAMVGGVVLLMLSVGAMSAEVVVTNKLAVKFPTFARKFW